MCRSLLYVTYSARLKCDEARFWHENEFLLWPARSGFPTDAVLRVPWPIPRRLTIRLKEHRHIADVDAQHQLA